MSWIFLATAGQFLNAVVAILDKYIVSDENVLPRPFVYAFYSCLLTGFWLVIFFVAFIPGLAELGVPSFANLTAPSIIVVALSFLAAYTFFMALVYMYDALKRADASNVMPVIGSVSAVSSFGMSMLFLEVSHSTNFLLGVVLLAVGTLLVAQTLPKRDTVLQVLHSGIFFALHWVTMRALFDETGFDDGFFWSRVAFVLFALSLLLVPAYLAKIRKQTQSTSKRAGAIVLFNKVLAGIAAFLLLQATASGENAAVVSVVQALDGLKFVFILLISLLLAQFLPDTAVEHDNRPKVVFRRFCYVVIILVGYFMLFT